MSRRAWLRGLWLAPALVVRAAAAQPALDIEVVPEGFGNASAADIRAVAASAAGTIWAHCATTRFRCGFRIVHDGRWPITHFDHAADGRIVIGLAVEGTYWARLAYQFSHEFCHALMDHSNDWTKRWRAPKHANQWLAESLCETGSLFALRAMARGWRSAPPYPNWRDYAVHLAEYAQERLDNPRHQLPDGETFRQWFARVEPVQREQWTRENNTIVAKQLLLLLEKSPDGWDALPFMHLGRRDAGLSLARFLGEWQRSAPAPHHPFIRQVAGVLGVTPE